MIAKLAGWKVLSVTYDNGLEFSGHITVGVALDARSYFCNPYSSWEKGGVENANGLLRQYLPKGMSFEDVDDLLLEGIEEEMNTRPREVLGFDCPMDYHANLLTAA
jgi:IS30 family transposase